MKPLVIVLAICGLGVAGLKVLSKPARRAPAALNLVKLTDEQTHHTALQIEFPTASPDGRYLAFQRTDDIKVEALEDGGREYDFTDESNGDIWRMRVDGTERMRLTDAGRSARVVARQPHDRLSLL